MAKRMPEVMYVVMAFTDWAELETSMPVRLSLSADEVLGQGFLSVYFDYETAKQHSGGAPVAAVRPKRKDEEDEA